MVMTNTTRSDMKLCDPAIPIKLTVVVGFWVLGLLFDLYGLLDSQQGGIDLLRIMLTTGLLYGLLRGREWARALAILLSLWAMAVLGSSLLDLLMQGALQGLSGTPLLGFCALFGVGFGHSVFVLWCMGQEDVQAWLMARACARSDH